MKRKPIPYCLVLILFFCFATESRAQLSCKSGKVDSRVAPLLEYIPNLTLEQERAIPMEERRKFSPPGFVAVPKEKMQSIKVTQDSIRVVVFRPDEPTSELLPVIVDYHGGAFYQALVPWMQSIPYGMANGFNAIVFAVDYRVAPEHPFPIPVMDCYHAFRWIVEHAKEFGGDPDKIILSGGSAGANLAAVVCHLAKADNIGKKIRAVSLFCPPVDSPFNSPYSSYTENAKGYGLTTDGACWTIENYVGSGLKDLNDFRLFPIRAKDFTNLPPTIIFTAEFDVLRDEGEAYYNKLKNAAVPVRYKCFPGQLHTLMGLPSGAREWEEMGEEQKAFFQKYL